jgi:exosortase A
MVSIWERSDTFAHGFLIIPISLWLVWEKRGGLKALMPRPSVWPLLLYMPIGFCWLVGYLVDTLVVQQFAFVGMLVVSIWSVLGHRVARYLAFPILFLFFGVPFGDGLIYPMMNFTADFTVGMLELTGIPVYREGTFFTIPTGQWSVVEACSGFRYLIASVTLGVLFAYLTYTRWWKRVLFVIASIIVPIVANGLRAYGLVMIGHLSNMNFGTGADHLFYGWIFFGVVITAMLAVGSIWRDPVAPDPVPVRGATAPVSSRDAFRVLSVIAVVAAFWPIVGWALSNHGGDVQAVAVEAPAAPEWELLENDAFWDWRPRIVGADGSIYAFYESDESAAGNMPVGLYLGVYRTQRQGAELVGADNLMVSPKDKVWSDTQIRPRKVQVGSLQLGVQQHELSSRRGERLLVWSWFLIGDHHTANPYLAKVLGVKSRLLGRHGEAALIAVAAPYVDHKESAARAMTDFLADMLPGIDVELDRSLHVDTGR